MLLKKMNTQTAGKMHLEVFVITGDTGQDGLFKMWSEVNEETNLILFALFVLGSIYHWLRSDEHIVSFSDNLFL